MRGWEEQITGIRECSCDECQVLNGTVQSLLLDCVVTNWNSDKNLKKNRPMIMFSAWVIRGLETESWFGVKKKPLFVM